MRRTCWVVIALLLGCEDPNQSAGHCDIAGPAAAPPGLHVMVGLEVAIGFALPSVCDAQGKLKDQGTLIVVDPTGVQIPATLEGRNSQLSAVFVPVVPGTYQLALKGMASTARGQVEAVSERATSFVGATYVERMNNCTTGPFRTLSGIVVCERNFGPLISVYGTDGSLLETFDGANLMVRGDSVWTTTITNPDVVELRVASTRELRLIGSAEVGIGGRTTPTETSGLTRRGVDQYFRTARYDGQTLTIEEVAEPYPDRREVLNVVTREGGEFWEGACRIRSGCPTMPAECAPQRRCIGGAEVVAVRGYIVDDEGAWLQGGSRLTPRPFDVSGNPSPVHQIFASNRSLGSLVQAGGQAPGLIVGNGVLIPKREGGNFHYELVPVPGQVLSITQEFIASLPDPMGNASALRFIRP